MVCVSLFLLPLAQLRAMLAESEIEPGRYMKLDPRTDIVVFFFLSKILMTESFND